jgi:hypothetical protein
MKWWDGDALGLNDPSNRTTCCGRRFSFHNQWGGDTWRSYFSTGVSAPYCALFRILNTRRLPEDGTHKGYATGSMPEQVWCARSRRRTGIGSKPMVGKVQSKTDGRLAVVRSWWGTSDSPNPKVDKPKSKTVDKLQSEAEGESKEGWSRRQKEILPMMQSTKFWSYGKHSNLWTPFHSNKANFPYSTVHQHHRQPRSKKHHRPEGVFMG